MRHQSKNFQQEEEEEKEEEELINIAMKEYKESWKAMKKSYLD
jgi:hypothetical protein